MTRLTYYLDPTSPDGLRVVEAPECGLYAWWLGKHYQAVERLRQAVESGMYGPDWLARMAEEVEDSGKMIGIHVEDCPACQEWIEAGRKTALAFARRLDCQEKTPARVGRSRGAGNSVNRIWAS